MMQHFRISIFIFPFFLVLSLNGASTEKESPHGEISRLSIAQAYEDGFFSSTEMPSLSTEQACILDTFKILSVQIEHTLIAHLLEQLQAITTKPMKLNLYEHLHRRSEFTLLHAAALHGHAKLVEKLAHPGNVNSCINGWHPRFLSAKVNKVTPLHIAALQGDIKTAKVLFAIKGILCNARDSNGNTPLHMLGLIYPAHRDTTELTTLMLEMGCCPHITNNEGLTPIKKAMDRSTSAASVLKLIGESRASSSSAAASSSSSSSSPVVTIPSSSPSSTSASRSEHTRKKHKARRKRSKDSKGKGKARKQGAAHKTSSSSTSRSSSRRSKKK